MRLILATNRKALDQYLEERAEDLGITVVNKAYYAEVLPTEIRQTPADAVLLAVDLPCGSQADIVDYVYEMRLADMRVIVLMGEPDPRDKTVSQLLALGVYDILSGRIEPQDIERVLARPMTLSDAVRALGVPGKPKPQPNFVDRLKTTLAKSERAEAQPAREAAPAPPEAVAPPKKPEAPRGDRAAPALPLVQPEETVMTRPNRPVVAVWSPVPAGKTFVALHLARALAQKGLKVGLADFDVEKQGLWAWLLLPQGEDALSRALSLEVVFSGVAGQQRHGFSVFSRDPSLGQPPVVQDTDLMRFLNSPKVPVDLVVCDLPGSLRPWVRDLLEHAWATVLVADQDYSRVSHIRAALAGVKWEPYVVLNRFAPFEGWDAKEAIGAEAFCTVEDLGADLYAAIATGRVSEKGVEALGKLAEGITEAIGAGTGGRATRKVRHGLPADLPR